MRNINNCLKSWFKRPRFVYIKPQRITYSKIQFRKLTIFLMCNGIRELKYEYTFTIFVSLIFARINEKKSANNIEYLWVQRKNLHSKFGTKIIYFLFSIQHQILFGMHGKNPKIDPISTVKEQYIILRFQQLCSVCTWTISLSLRTRQFSQNKIHMEKETHSDSTSHLSVSGNHSKAVKIFARCWLFSSATFSKCNKTTTTMVMIIISTYLI